MAAQASSPELASILAKRPSVLPTPGTPNVLYVVDLPGYVFRAYHALEPLNGPTGEPTWATYGTLNMLVKLVRERQPTHVAVALEGGRGERSELYTGYKANRPPPPPELSVQMQRCQEIVRAYKIPILMAPGFEADDVIASIVRQAKSTGLSIVLATADKDLMQLVDDRCVMWDAMRDRVYGEREVVEKLGVPPRLVRDLLALVGDTSDNVPGVPGVGPKTAADLLLKYETLDGVYAHIDEITKPKLKQSLVEHQPEARVSQTLVTLRDQAPVVFDEAALRRAEPDGHTLHAIFKELGFVRYIGMFPQGGPKVRPPAEPSRSTMVTDRAALEALVARANDAGRLSIAIGSRETESREVVVAGVALAIEPGEGFYVPIAHRYLGAPVQLGVDVVFDVLRPILENGAVHKIGHDLKGVERILRDRGIRMHGASYDAMLASYLLDPEAPNDLDTVSDRDGGLKLKRWEEVAPKQRGVKATIDDLEVEIARDYLAPRADAVVRLEKLHRERMEEAGVARVFDEIEMPLAEGLADLEETGVFVDLGTLSSIGESMQRELTRLETEARDVSGHADLNVGSPKQLEAILFDELGLKAIKKTKTGRSTDAEALEAIADEHALPGIVLEHRAIAKLKGTYVDALPRLVHPKTGRIHGHWRQAVAATGRLSSEDPNLQNIPIRTDLGREIRRAFVAPPGYLFLSADYSQIELRVLAHLSKDPVLLDAFRSGQDIHTRTAMEIFGVDEADVTDDMRRKSKTVNFGVIYGMGETALGKRLAIPRAEAARFIETYFERYRGVAEFMTRTMTEARRNERVRTMLGRIRMLPDLRSSDRMRRAYAERIAQNTPIQGSAADILKLAMIKLRAPVVDGARMILTVHDELDFEVPEAKAEEAMEKVRAAMESVVPLEVPLVVDAGVGKSWAEVH